MNDLDLDRLGDLWRTSPDPAELDQLRRSAGLVQRRARVGQISDFLLAALVSAVVVMLVLSNPRLDTALLGGAAIVAMLLGTIRQRRLRQEELRTLSASTDQMLDQIEARLRSTVTRARLNLIGAAPAVLIGVAFGWTLDSGAGSPLLTRFSASPLTSLLVASVIVAILVIALAHFARALRQAKLELGEIIRMRDDFRSEADTSQR